MVVALGIPQASAKMKWIIAGSLLFVLFNPTARSNENFSVSAVANVSMFCVNLPVHEANLTFCEILTKWEPRINKIGGIFACVIPTLISWTFTVLVIAKLRKKIKETMNASNESNESTSSVCIGYLLFYGKLIWDAVDTTLDSYLFYQLEFGQAIDENIFRNIHVNNSILAFAIIGSIKVLFFLLFGIHCNERNQDCLDLSKLDQLWYAFLLEDGPELILEYFYVEKYVSLKPPWYLLVRDMILAFVSLYIVYRVLKWFLSEREDNSAHNGREDNSAHNGTGHPSIAFKIPRLFTLFTSQIGVLMFLRVGGAGYQYVSRHLKRDCFNVHDGMLLQNPFSGGCLNEVEYIIITLSCILLIPSVFIGFAGFYFTFVHAISIIYP